MQETSSSSAAFARKRFRLPTALVLAASVVTGASGCGSASSDAQAGEVVRVIDGDTLVINFEGEDQRVRLLNIDTPETKHPDKAVECLGPEATAFLESMLLAKADMARSAPLKATKQPLSRRHRPDLARPKNLGRSHQDAWKRSALEYSM